MKIKKISENYNISKEAIYAEVNKEVYDVKSSEKILLRPIAKKEKQTEINPITIKRENMVIYLLINYFKESYEPIVTNISPDDFKLEQNKFIFEKILNSTAEESEKIVQSLANIEDSEIQSHISEILVTDYEISSVDKCIEDVVNTYNKERLTNRKNEIVKQLENISDSTSEKKSELENELNNIIIELAKRK